MKRERPVMIHRAVLGSVEQMFFILLEHYEGKWPFWLSPRQAIVCSLSEKHRSYAEKVLNLRLAIFMRAPAISCSLYLCILFCFVIPLVSR